MAIYTKLGIHEIQTLAQEFGIEVEHFSAIEGGEANSSYLLNASDGDYVMTITDDKPVETVLNLIRLLEYLAQYDFPSSRINPTLGGEAATYYDGRAVYLKTYIDGCTVQNISEEGLVQLGSGLARLHQIPAPDYLPPMHDYGMDSFRQAFGWGFDVDYEDWLAKKKWHLKNQLPTDLPHGLIHADIFWDNLIYLDEKLQALIDFEDACAYSFMYDLGIACFGVCVENRILNLEKVSHIMRGYQQFRKLEDKEKNSLQDFTVYAGTAISFWRYRKYHVQNPTEEKKDRHRQAMVLVDGTQTIPTSLFQQVFD